MSETKPTIKPDPGATTGAGATVDQKPKPNVTMTARGRAHPNLKELDAVTWSYNNWKTDTKEAENYHFNAPSKFPDKLAAMKRKQKIHNGDRSHANLAALDAVAWTYYGWQGDKTIAEDFHCKSYDVGFTNRYDLMKRKQALRDGDRSDPTLVALDSQTWTYDGWKRDKKEVEGYYGGPYFTYFTLCSKELKKMGRAQALHDGDRRHDELRRLDALKLSYADWQIDKSTAEKCHIKGRSYEFSEKLVEMEDRQRSHEQKVENDQMDTEAESTTKDRKVYHNLDTSSTSHAYDSGVSEWDGDNLDGDSFSMGDDVSEASGDDESETSSFELHDDKGKVGTEAEVQSKKQKHKKSLEVATPDALSAVGWTYPGWLDDKSEASKALQNSPESLDALLEAMRENQKRHERSLDPKLVALDTLQLTYPGWKNDKKIAENSMENHPILANKEMDYLQKKEKLHTKDASDPRVLLLNSLTWMYPDWDSDKSTVEGFYRNSYYNFDMFDDKLAGMKHKQQAHEGNATCPILLLDAVDEPTQSVVFGDGSAANPVVLDDSTSAGARPRRKRRQPTKKRRNKGGTTGTRNPTVNNSSKCVVCFVKDKSHALQPCAHRCVCNDCSDWALNENKCPVCNETVVSAELSAVNETAENTMLDLTNQMG